MTLKLNIRVDIRKHLLPVNSCRVQPCVRLYWEECRLCVEPSGHFKHLQEERNERMTSGGCSSKYQDKTGSFLSPPNSEKSSAQLYSLGLQQNAIYPASIYTHGVMVHPIFTTHSVYLYGQWTLLVMTQNND